MLVSFGLLLVAQGVFFLHILQEKPVIVAADIVVAFEGRLGRAREAYALADQEYAPALVISPANDQRLATYDRQFRPGRSFVKLHEEKARTTFENALYTADIIKHKGFKSVILVTSWDHMPRSYLLLRLMLMSSGSRIYPHTVATGAITQRNWYRHTLGWKMVYNEMVETWGSLLECARYRTTGQIPLNEPGRSGLLARLKKLLLFDIRLDAPAEALS